MNLVDLVSLKDLEQRYSPKWYAMDRVQALMLENEALSVQEAVVTLVELETDAYLRGSNDKEQFSAVIDVAVMAGVTQEACHQAMERAMARSATIEYGDGRAES